MGESIKPKDLYIRYAAALKFWIFKRRKNMQDAEDMVQDIFIKVVRNDPQLENDVVAREYLYKSALRKLLDVWDKPYLPEDEVSTVIEERHPLIYPHVDLDNLRNLHPYIQQLPPERKKIFMLCMSGWKLKDIAKLLKLAESTVKTQKKSAIRSLNKALQIEDAVVRKLSA